MIRPRAARRAARRPQWAVKWDRNLKPKLAIMRQCTSVTDRRTDGQTDGRWHRSISARCTYYISHTSRAKNLVADSRNVRVSRRPWWVTSDACPGSPWLHRSLSAVVRCRSRRTTWSCCSRTPCRDGGRTGRWAALLAGAAAESGEAWRGLDARRRRAAGSRAESRTSATAWSSRSVGTRCHTVHRQVYYFFPRQCDEYVCLSVCLSARINRNHTVDLYQWQWLAYISKTICPNLTKVSLFATHSSCDDRRYMAKVTASKQ